MGTSSSKFKKFLFNGDEFAAMQIYLTSPELQKNLNPNVSYGESHNHDTAMHYAAKHGMKHLLRAFLQDLGGNPNKRNGSNQTCLHAICLLGPNKSASAMERRAACVSILVQWRGAPLEDGNREKVDLAAQDQFGNTALHLAAASGLEHCVLSLLTAGSPLFVENKEKQTPCDLAVKYGHVAIAHLLETKMVFDGNLDVHNEDELSQGAGEEVYCGLRAQDLQEAKDQLLVETSDMLQVPLFTAEALLRDNEWSRELLLDKWMKDAVACCQLAGVEVPPSAKLQHSAASVQPEDVLEPSEKPCEKDEVAVQGLQTPIDDASLENQDIECGICLMTVKIWEQPNIKIPCHHNFCAQCWESYLASKILEGMHHDILCPAFQCSILVPLDVIERLVSPDLKRRYLHFDIKAFVDSNKCIKWCPVAGCGRAVKLPEAEHLHSADAKSRTPLTSHAVDCGNGHFFCWECLGEAHAPSGCAQWKLWLDKVKQVRPEELDSNLKDLEVASNCLWLVTNSKPCPNCKSPIQKTEGCNHIKCSKCKFDFCWVCLEGWKKHSSATGGYFRCNRFPAASKAEEKQGVLYTEAVVRGQQIQDLNRFIHYYTRFKNHENSRKLEEPILLALKRKMEALATTSLVSAKDKENFTKFIEDGVRELLKARRVLCGSYVYGFYLDENGYSRTIFEFMQNELEAVTEKLSEMMARPYLKTPWQALLQMTALARRKRHEFIRAVSKGLIPPETPPSRRHRRRRYPGILVVDPSSDTMSQAIAASLRTLNPTDVWVKDGAGRHSNIAAICDWPSIDAEAHVRRAMAISLMGKCRREGCARPRARNTRTQELDEYCSLWCAASPQASSATNDESMDLAIALEMSRLQMIEDTMKREHQSTSKPRTSVSNTQTDSETDLKKAIALSLVQQNVEIDVAADSRTIPPPYSPIEYYRKTKEDITVDYFLKSLAGQHSSVNLYSPDSEKPMTEKESPVVSRQPRAEDGRFEISEIHENCFHEDETDNSGLRRAHSTGDLSRGADRRQRYRDVRYHLDSDHSSQHEEKPEDVARNLLCCQSNMDKFNHNDDQLFPTCPLDEDSDLPNTAVSVSDTFSVDMEVCHIMSSERTEDTVKIDTLGKFKTPQERQTVENARQVYSTSRKALSKRASLDEGCSRSESVKNIIEEVKCTLKAIENESLFADGSRNWQQRMFEFDSSGGEFSRHCPERASTGKIKNNPEVASHMKFHSGTKSVTTLENLKEYSRKYPASKEVLLVGSDKTLNEAHKRAFKAAGGKILHKKDISYGSKEGISAQKCGSNLRIRIAKSPIGLVTDSSNEYESETGIPKSPTLFISGVSISRTPEPCSPASLKDKRSPEHKSGPKGSPLSKNLSNLHGKINSYPILNFVAASIDIDDCAVNNTVPPEQFEDNRFLSCGRQSRSSSLTVPKPNNQSEPYVKKLNISCGAIPSPHCDKNRFHSSCVTPPRNSAIPCIEITAKESEGVFNFGTCNHKALSHCFFQTIPSMEVDIVAQGEELIVESVEDTNMKSVKSKSASEPERDREVFRFPKSSTDGALSSVLHVQESNLSSDDFHEVLFLLERSPKHNSKRRKRSKKERDKVKEGITKDDCNEASSIL